MFLLFGLPEKGSYFFRFFNSNLSSSQLASPRFPWYLLLRLHLHRLSLFCFARLFEVLLSYWEGESKQYAVFLWSLRTFPPNKASYYFGISLSVNIRFFVKLIVLASCCILTGHCVEVPAWHLSRYLSGSTSKPILPDILSFIFLSIFRLLFRSFLVVFSEFPRERLSLMSQLSSFWAEAPILDLDSPTKFLFFGL